MSHNRFRVLLLGDGNFSFTLSLCQLLFQRDLDTNDNAARLYLGISQDFPAEAISILATSFDSHAELLDKYPECRAILQKLDAFGSEAVQVRHEINAWELQTHFGHEFPNGFDVVIWNHPHLGTEDFRLHRFLMAHFLDSAKGVLRRFRDNFLPRVCISLVDGQETRWSLHEEASFIGFEVHDILPLMEFPGYVCKRNKNGQSFKNLHTLKHCRSEMMSFVHRLVVSQDGPKLRATSTLLDQQVTDTISKLKISDKTELSFSPAKVVLFDPAVQGKPPKVCKTKSALKVEKTHMVASADILYQCPECDRSFPSLRGIRQHHHGAHVLKLYEIHAEKSFQCDVEACAGKSFSKEVDLLQHKISKHSTLSQEEKQIVYGKNSVDSEEHETQPKYFPCSVCGQSVMKTADDDGMFMHLETLKPLIGKIMTCPLNCDSTRTFLESRALEQHYRVCRERREVKI